MTEKKHYADAAYQRERRAKIAAGEIVPRKPGTRRMGLDETLESGSPWVEVFTTRYDANTFQKVVHGVASRRKFKVKCKTYLAVDPETETAVFIVEARRVEA